MPREHRITVSATEMPHFRRLVQFVTDVSDYADVTADAELQQIVRCCRIDLLHLMRGEGEVDEFDA